MTKSKTENGVHDNETLRKGFRDLLYEPHKKFQGRTATIVPSVLCEKKER